MQPAVTTTKAFANYPHIVQEVPGLFVFSGQGHRVAGTEPAVYRGHTVHPDHTASYNVKEATQGVLENIQKALQTQSLTLGHLSSLIVYVVDKSMVKEVTPELDTISCLTTLVIVSELPGLNVVEMEGTACSDLASLETLYPQYQFFSFNRDITKAVKEVFTSCQAQLKTDIMTLQNLTHVTLTLQDQKTQYAALNAVWNALFPKAESAPTRTCVFQRTQLALVCISIRTSPNQICEVNEQALQ